MKNTQEAKKATHRPSESVHQDLTLARFCELRDLVKEHTKELDEIKETLKHTGTHNTDRYVCVVSETSRAVVPSIKRLIELYGPSFREHCRDITYKSVKVSPKGGE